MATLGIDTSCYTTSVALTEGGELVVDLREKLEVAKGGLGLRQSEALFRHIRNLPGLIEKAFSEARRYGIVVDSIAASAWPRRAEGSYMPVFNAGRGFAAAVASSLGRLLIEVSHQEGHIAACAPESGLSPGDSFLAVHISGGTTEVLKVAWYEDSMHIDSIACTTDISAGQMIDRVGTSMGIQFPAGPGLELLAMQTGPAGFRIPSSVSNGNISFSGPCEAASRGLKDGVEPGEVARAVLDCVVRSISKAVIPASETSGLTTVLVVGGVASNSRVRNGLSEELGSRGIETLFGKESLSTDNAVGVAYLGELWR